MGRFVRLFTVGLVLLSAACARNEGAGDPAAAPASAAFPVTVEAANGIVEVPTRPRRIVSLSPTATEMLFAVGAGEQVAAVDEQSDHPREAPTTKLSGYEPNSEAVIGYEPDLVVASEEHPGLSKALEAVDVPYLVQPAAVDLDDTYEQMLQLGRITGNEDAATAAVEKMRTDIDALIADLPEFEDAPSYYHELDDTYFSVTSETFIGQVYALMGLENIADEAKGAGSGYPQLSAEYIIDADPDLIFLADTKCCGQSLETVARRPGWDQIAAVKNGAVVELDDSIASRWGPRVVTFIEIVSERVVMLDQAKS